MGTGYASRHASSYKNLEQLFRVHLGSSVHQGLSAQYRSFGSQDGYCSWTLPANLASVFSNCFIRSHVWAWGEALPGMHQWRLSLRSDFPQACWAALPFNIACKPILLSHPARAVLHSACSVGEMRFFAHAIAGSRTG